MADNQASLDISNEDDRRQRAYKHALNAAVDKQAGFDVGEPQPFEGEEDMQINIDSPTTITQAAPEAKPAIVPEVKQAAGSWTVAKLAGAAAGLGGGVGLPVAAGLVAASMLLPDATPEATTPAETPSTTIVAPAGPEGRIGLLPPDELPGAPPATAFDVPPVGEPMFVPEGM